MSRIHYREREAHIKIAIDYIEYTQKYYIKVKNGNRMELIVKQLIENTELNDCRIETIVLDVARLFFQINVKEIYY